MKHKYQIWIKDFPHYYIHKQESFETTIKYVYLIDDCKIERHRKAFNELRSATLDIASEIDDQDKIKKLKSKKGNK